MCYIGVKRPVIQGTGVQTSSMMLTFHGLIHIHIGFTGYLAPVTGE